jgi:hypothetical protein
MIIYVLVDRDVTMIIMGLHNLPQDLPGDHTN